MRKGFVTAWLVAGACGAAMAGTTLAQDAGPTEPLPLDQRFFQLIREGAYLAAMDLVENSPRGPASEAMDELYRQYRPSLDGFTLAPAGADLPLPAPDPAALARYEQAAAADAIAAIVERARRTRVVVINEGHDSPRDRAFILKVAEALRPLGYSIYSAEALMVGPDDVMAREMARLVREGYPTRMTGSYSSDPVFSSLLRGVVALGYQPTGHEQRSFDRTLDRDQRIAAREEAQAENLARAIAAAGPEAKFLVHVGYAHAAETPLPPNDQPWMAMRLKRMTGIDPLTIDQTTLTEFAPQPSYRALYAALAPRVGGHATAFLMDGRSLGHGLLGAATDLQVLHPPVRTVRGRPDWLATTGRRAVPIPADWLPRQGRRLVQAFGATDAPDAVPLDQALVVAGAEPPVLYLPPDMAVRWAMQE